MNKVTEIDYKVDSRYLQFIAEHPAGTIYHHPAWLSTLEQEYGKKCLCLACEDFNGRLRGILPLFYTRGFPIRVGRHQLGRRLSSLPRTPLAGPLAASTAATAALLNGAMARVRCTPGVQLEIKTSVPDLDKLVEGLQCVRWRDTYVRCLPNHSGDPQSLDRGLPLMRPCGPCEECRILRFGNAHDSHQVKWAVNKARKQGLSVRLAESEVALRDWYTLYLHAMQRNVVPVRSYRFFQHLWNNAWPARMLLVLIEQELNGKCRLISGSIVLMFGQTAFWAFTGSDQEDFALHPNDLTLWHGLHDACKRGYRWYDLGEVAENHPELARFKAKWGTELIPIWRYYYPASIPSTGGLGDLATPITGAASYVWKRLPYSVVARVSDWIYSYL